MATEELVDLSQINDISEGDMSFEEEIITMYLSDTEERISTIQQLLENENWDDLKREAHTLKGSSGNVGVNSIFSLCKSLEAASLDKDRALAGQLISNINDTSGKVSIFFKDYLKEHND